MQYGKVDAHAGEKEWKTRVIGAHLLARTWFVGRDPEEFDCFGVAKASGNEGGKTDIDNGRRRTASRGFYLHAQILFAGDGTYEELSIRES